MSQVNSASDQFFDKQQDFADYRRSLGIYTDEEKEAARLAAVEQAQEELGGLDWNSEDAEGIYRSFASPEDIHTMETAKGIGTTVATLPFTAGMIGWVPALTTTATGMGGGYAGSYGGQKLGQWVDGKYGTNLTPGLTVAGGLIGGTLGGGFGYKGTVKLGSQGLLPRGGQAMYGKQFVTDVASDAFNRNVIQMAPTLNYISNGFLTPDSHRTTFTPAQQPGGRYTFYERPSTYFKDATYAGTPGTYAKKEVPTWQLPKHNRTNIVKEKDAMIQKLHDIDYSYTPYIEDAGTYVIRPAVLNRTMSRDDVLNTLIEQGKDQSIVNMYDFIQTLPKDINPRFLPVPSSKGMAQNPYVTRYRDAVLETVPASELLTDEEVARFLTFYDKQLSEGVTGALKDVHLWHASKNNFNIFDYLSHLGENMNNTGVYGPGNYFTTRLPINHYAGLKGHNIQPYYVTNIKETIPAAVVRNKKGYPIYVKSVDGTIPTHRSGNLVIVGENTTQNNSSFNMFLPKVMSKGELVGSKLNKYYDNNVFEVVVPRNTGIKSLYPNMSRFVRNADGSVSFTPVDWNDPRVDFKHGGKLKI